MDPLRAHREPVVADRRGRYIVLMRFTPEFLDEIKARVTVSDVVGRRVRLKKQGREWRGLSPFNAEKTPSFYVNDAKMQWFDFSSGRNGNVFDFVMATDGLSFPDAVEVLAAEAGLDLPKSTPESAAREQKRAGLVEVLELAAQFFERVLKDRAGIKGRDYLATRGIAPALQAEFRLGFAPAERYALRDHLAGKGASVDVMIEAGLLIHGDDIAVPYDRFRDRVMFPIADRSGHVIAFGGRALDAAVPAKYLNSPETPLFHKGAVLYNHHRARKAVQEHGSVIAVEGYVDVIAMTAAGFPNVVAPLGTALTLDQCDLLWRMSHEPILCFDGDKAGRRAAHKAIDTVLPALGPEKTLRFAFLPDGQDPDDLARSGGNTAIAAVLAQARPLVDVLWTRETEAVVLDTPERRAGLEHRLGDLTKTIGDESLRRYYGAELRSRLQTLTGQGQRRPAAGPRPARPATSFGARSRFAQQPLRGYRGSAPAPLSGSFAAPAQAGTGAYSRSDVEILTLVMNHPRLLDRHAEDLAHLDIGHPELARFRDLVVDLLAAHYEDHALFKAALDARGGSEVRRRIEEFAARLPHWCLSPEAAESDAELMLGQALTLHRKARELHKELVDATLALARDGSDSHFAQVRDLKAMVTTLEGTEATVEGYGSLSGHDSADD